MTPDERVDRTIYEWLAWINENGGDPHVPASVWRNLRDRMDTAIREAVAEEREACAKTAEDYSQNFEAWDGLGVMDSLETVAAIIRARGETHAEDRNLAG